MNFCNISDIKGVEELKRTVLKNPSKESQELFYSTVDYWLYEYNRLPNADEFPPIVGVDSLHILEDKLKFKKLQNGFETTNSKLKEYTGKDSPEEMGQVLGELHKDYNFKVTKIDEDSSIVEAFKRPSTDPKEIDIMPELPIAEGAVGHLMDRIRTIHGINLHEVRNKDVARIPDFPGASMLKGFVRNGDIYINTDNATPDTKIHELMHLFMGGIRYQNPYLYQNLLKFISNDPDLVYKMNQFRHRTEMDRAEEVLVDEISKYLSNQDSAFNKLGKNETYELDYHIRRLLDTMLDGDFSNKIISPEELYTSSLTKVARIVNSREIFNNMTGTMSQGFVHRVMNNYKSNLLKSGKLKEIC